MGMVVSRILGEDFFERGGDGDFSTGFGVDTDVDGFGGPGESFGSVGFIDLVRDCERRVSDMGNREMDFDGIGDSKGDFVIGFGVDDDKHEFLIFSDLVEGDTVFFKEIFHSIVNETELAGEVEDAGHICVMHTNFIFGNKDHGTSFKSKLTKGEIKYEEGCLDFERL